MKKKHTTFFHFECKINLEEDLHDDMKDEIELIIEKYKIKNQKKTKKELEIVKVE